MAHHTLTAKPHSQLRLTVACNDSSYHCGSLATSTMMTVVAVACTAGHNYCSEIACGNAVMSV